MNENKQQFSSFVESIRNNGAEKLSKETLLFWVTFLREHGLSEAKFVRRDCGSVWLSAPGISLRDLARLAGEPWLKTVDGGNLSFAGETEIDILIDGDLGLSNKGKNETERLFTILILSQKLGNRARMVASKK